ncbi:hypothetical protein ACU8KH_00045 [Lachancea thermotolerans]
MEIVVFSGEVYIGELLQLCFKVHKANLFDAAFVYLGTEVASFGLVTSRAQRINHTRKIQDRQPGYDIYKYAKIYDLLAASLNNAGYCFIKKEPR